jgi:hypothetical protein
LLVESPQAVLHLLALLDMSNTEGLKVRPLEVDSMDLPGNFELELSSRETAQTPQSSQS